MNFMIAKNGYLTKEYLEKYISENTEIYVCGGAKFITISY